MLLLFLGNALSALVFISEEKLLSKFYCHPLEIVGIEGTFGLGATVAVLFMLQNVSCETIYADSEKKIASFCPYGRLEDSVRAIKHMMTEGELATAVLLTVGVLALIDYCGVSITKHVSAMHRVVITSGRPICIWLVAFVLSWEHFIPLQFAGYILTVIGIFLYYQIISFDCLFRRGESEESAEETRKEELVSAS